MKYPWKKKKIMTRTWFEHATFWTGVRRATVAPPGLAEESYLLHICMHIPVCLVIFLKYHFNVSARSCAFVAQGLEHWSCKPGVESSNLSEGFLFSSARKDKDSAFISKSNFSWSYFFHLSHIEAKMETGGLAQPLCCRHAVLSIYDRGWWHLEGIAAFMAV